MKHASWKLIFLLFTLMQNTQPVKAQSCIVQAPVLFGSQQTRFYQKYDPVTFGVFNSQITQTYEFTLKNNSKGGPLIGNGGGLSVSAFMRGAEDAGDYRVTASRPNCLSAFTEFFAYYNDIDNLSITNWGSNAVSFKWSSSGQNVLYEYAITTEVDPNSGSIAWSTTTDTVAGESGLVNGTTYYIHVRCALATTPFGIVYPDITVTRTLRFVSCSGNPPVGGIIPNSMSLCVPTNGFPSNGIFTASGGTSYQWYYNGSQIPGTNPNISVNSNQPGIYGVEVTTNEGCSGMVYTANLSYRVYQNPKITVKGNHCWGDSVRVGVSNTEVGVQYSVLDPSGQQIGNFSGIGRAQESGDTIWTSFLLNNSNQIGNCQVYSTNGCGVGATEGWVGIATPVTGLTTITINSTSVLFDWDGNFGEEFEYAVTTSSIPPQFGTAIIKSFPPWVYGLSPSTLYYIHVRPKCGQASIPWTTISFTTSPLVPNCASPIPIGLCTNVTAIIPTGEGSWDFQGFYPSNSTGASTPGRELVYSFTPTQDGVYYLDVSASNTTSAFFSYLYKPASDGCSSSGWTGIRSISSVGKYPVGMLTAGVSYLILIDKSTEYGSTIQQTFRICRATVGAPGLFNSCITTNGFSDQLAPNGGKEEFFVDNSGNLIASVDFRNIPDYNYATVNISYYVNNNTIRRDGYNREYLDRQFTMEVSGSMPAYQKVPVKLYFRNSELQRVINEPDDGIADVADISGLNATFGDLSCTGPVTSSSSTAFILQNGNGAYDPNSGYISLIKPENAGNIYLNGGNAELNYFIYPNSFESFDSAQLPKDWRHRFVTGTNTVSTQQSTINPVTTPFHGPRFAWWNSRNFTAGGETRFITAPLKTTGIANVTAEFYWYNNNNPGFPNEGVQLEYSLDGNTWVSAGAFIPRHDPTAPVSGQWNKKRVALPAAAGNRNYIYVAFKLRSQQGDNCGIDGVTFLSTPSCPLLVSTITVTNLTSNSVTYNWPSVAGANAYEHIVSLYPLPFSGTITTGTSGNYNGMTISTEYYIHVRPRCAGNIWGTWTTIKVVTPATNPDCNWGAYLYPGIYENSTIPSGMGSWDFSGTYPDNSVGQATPGRERFYKFFPDQTGVYYIEIHSSVGGYIDCFYKQSATCSNTGWTGIDRFNGPKKRAIGLLQGGIPYDILIDNESTDAVSYSFAILRADILSGNQMDCVPAIPITNIIPANSPKEEFIIDEDGSLIAGFSFTGVSNSVGKIALSGYKHLYTPYRRNQANMEYLNRNWSVHFDNAPANPVGVKFFYLGNEYGILYNEPKDCIGDIDNRSDLTLSYGPQNCSSVMAGAYATATQVASGFLPNDEEWVMFQVPGIAGAGGNTSFFLHGPPVSDPAPAISPASVSICTGSTQVLTVSGSWLSFQWYRNGVPINGATSSTYTVSQAGVYSVVVGSQGCSREAANTVTVNVTPGGSITPTSASLCQGATQVLTTSGGQTYQWFRNGIPLGPPAVSPTYAATLSGTYTVTIINGSCTMPGYNSAGLNFFPAPMGITTATVCSNMLPYIFNGNPYNATGIYDFIIHKPDGCDSIARLNLTVKPAGASTTNITRCSNQLPYVWNGNNYNTTGIYNVLLPGSNGCDSTATLNLTVNPVSTSTSNITICTNQIPYTWNGNNYTTTGVYNVTLVAANGCDSIATLNLVVNAVLTSTTNITICPNLLPYTWNGNAYMGPGTFSVTLLSQAGCDSIATLNLTVNPVLTSTSNIAVCENEMPFNWNGNNYNTAGTYTATLTGSNGCDSIATLVLSVKPVLTSTTNLAVCSNQLPFMWNGNAYTGAGTYTVTLPGSNACDSIATLNLTINPVSASTTNESICTNQVPYTWNGNSYNSTGVYNVTLVGANGCDSIATLNLTVNSVLTSTTNTTICPNQLPYTWNGNSYTGAGTFQVTLISQSGCDSIATLNLTVNPVLTSTTSASVCENQLPYMWNGNSYSIAGTFNVTLAGSNGCDSIATLNLTIKTVSTSVTNVTVCTNLLPYNWNGNNYNTAGTFQVTLTGSNECDSIATLNLAVNAVSTSTTNENICTNQVPFTWNGNTYSITGVYTVTLMAANGCDSVATLNLTVNPVLTSTTNTTVCQNQLPFVWNGNNYSSPGTYNITLISQSGCDSIATLHLFVNPVLTSSTNISVCENLLPYTWNGNIYNTAGIYNITLTGSNGCDSIATLHLLVKPVLTSATNADVCSNHLPYTWNGNNYNTAGTYSVTLAGSNGCDSVATLNLVIKPVSTSTTTIGICTNQVPYTWNGNSYTSSGIYTVTLVAANGCDSIATLDLAVNPVVTSTTNSTVCANLLPFIWNGNSYAGAGVYSVTLVSQSGCDSIAMLNLAVNPVLTSTTTASVCENMLPYTWNGNTYSASGNYSVTLAGSNGCDSIANLQLIVKPVLTSSTNATTCENHLPYTWNGNNYNAAGTYSVTLTGTNGCDSIATLHLAVNPVLTSTTNASVCLNHLPFTWNGNNYIAAGSYTVTLTGSTGCDSLATLILTIRNVTTSTTAVDVCSNQLPYTWNGNNYSTPGTYNVTLMGSNGCDSIATLVLQIRPSPASTTLMSVCANELPVTWNSNSYNSAGTYVVTLAASNGCDSLATLVLSVKPLPSGSITPASAEICSGETVQFSIGGGVAYQWLLDNNPVPGANGTTYLASIPGNYTVEILGANGCSSISANTATLTVKVKPSAAFNTASLCEDEPILFTNTTAGAGTGNLVFSWNFGDNSNSTQGSPTHTYAQAGLYTVTLIAAPAGCPALADTLTKQVTIVDAIPGVRYSNAMVIKNVPTVLNARNIGTQYNWIPPAALNDPTLQSPMVTTSTDRDYLIEIRTSSGCKIVDSVKVIAFEKVQVFVPKAFTPNANNTNDILRPLGAGIISIDYFRVYNRWGQLVYQTQTIGEGWNGIYKNQPQPTETYTWIFQGKGADGTVIKASGKTVLIR